MHSLDNFWEQLKQGGENRIIFLCVFGNGLVICEFEK